MPRTCFGRRRRRRRAATAVVVVSAAIAMVAAVVVLPQKRPYAKRYKVHRAAGTSVMMKQNTHHPFPNVGERMVMIGLTNCVQGLGAELEPSSCTQST